MRARALGEIKEHEREKGQSNAFRGRQRQVLSTGHKMASILSI
jgi:hypothetical protein